MRKIISEVTNSEVLELADRYGIEVGDAEAEAITDGINDRLERFDEVYEIPLAGQRNLGERSWWEPTDDNPYNAISTHCNVEPTADHNESLSGTTVALKDIISVAGVPLQCGSGVMRGYVPSSDATVVRRLRESGATIAAKATLDEFAGGGRAMSFRGRILNPRDPNRVAGGSSGGSAAAVAAGLVDVALGTDTGGSARLPAAFCGVVGLKPTYGLVPMTGVMENTYSLDHVGPMASTVKETAMVLEAIAGKDPDDPASMAAAGRDDYHVGGYVAATRDPPEPAALSVGFLEDGFETVTDGVEERTLTTIDQLEDAGASIRPVSVDGFDLGPIIKNTISFCELAAYWRDGGAPLRRSGEAAGDPGDQLGFARRARAASGELNTFYRSRILAGAHLLESYDGRHYTRAMRAKRIIRDRFESALRDVDVLVWPTVRDVAPLVEEADLPDMAFGRNTRIVNLTGLPAISVPNGTVEGAPVGIQLLAPAFAEAELLAGAATIESVQDGTDQ